MNVTEILSCGAEEQKKAARLSESIREVVTGHDSGINDGIPGGLTGSGGGSPDGVTGNIGGSVGHAPGIMSGNSSEAKEYIAKLNGLRARVGMEIRLLDRYRDEAECLAAGLNVALEKVSACSEPCLAAIASDRAEKLRLSKTVCTQLAAAAAMTSAQYGEYADTLKAAVMEMKMAMKQSDIIDLVQIWAKARSAAENGIAGDKMQ